MNYTYAIILALGFLVIFLGVLGLNEDQGFLQNSKLYKSINTWYLGGLLVLFFTFILIIHENKKMLKERFDIK